MIDTFFNYLVIIGVPAIIGTVIVGGIVGWW
jgi:hypothetical protein